MSATTVGPTPENEDRASLQKQHDGQWLKYVDDRLVHGADSADSGSNSLQRIVDAFLSQPGLSFASVLSAERIERGLRKTPRSVSRGYLYDGPHARKRCLDATIVYQSPPNCGILDP